MTIKSLDDVVSKLASECDESAVALCSAVQTLQRGVQAEIRNLCKPWGVQLTAKNDNGKFSKRADHVLKSELTTTFIEKAREHVKAKASETQQLQHAATKHAQVMQLKKHRNSCRRRCYRAHRNTVQH